MVSSVGIISYGCGNVQSVKNAVEYCGSKPELITSTSDLQLFDKIILPGVGAFDHAMKNLDEMQFTPELKKWVENQDNKLMGICLGMQLLCNQSEESVDSLKGLGLVDAEVKLLKSDLESRLPNIGWSEVEFSKPEFEHHSGDYYFVHSYGVFCQSEISELGCSYYGNCRFSSAITNGVNVFGYQFHPEKSHLRGLGLIKDFCAL